jgi:hypothetical protein
MKASLIKMVRLDGGDWDFPHLLYREARDLKRPDISLPWSVSTGGPFPSEKLGKATTPAWAVCEECPPLSLSDAGSWLATSSRDVARVSTPLQGAEDSVARCAWGVCGSVIPAGSEGTDILDPVYFWTIVLTCGATGITHAITRNPTRDPQTQVGSPESRIPARHREKDVSQMVKSCKVSWHVLLTLEMPWSRHDYRANSVLDAHPVLVGNAITFTNR